jgi:hypothetical protein
VGDELLIPDTTTPSSATLGPRRESTVTIAAISGAVVTLSKPLDFAHKNIVDPQGAVVLRPRVANLTRNIVWRSENPNGSRGHTVDIGHTATWDIRYNQNIGLGRTRNEPQDDTVLETQHIGTNERGRYAEHHHHTGSSPTSVDMGNVYMGVGSRAAKWALVVHNTSDTLIEGNIASDFPGAGFVTEDGYEVRNVFRHNLAAYSLGNKTDSKANINANCPGCEGAGFWLRGVMNTTEGNEGWNSFKGLVMMNQQQPAGLLYPSAPRTMPDTVLDPTKAVPIRMVGNIGAANSMAGFEQWGTSKYPNDHLTVVNNTSDQFISASSVSVSVYLKHPIAVCEIGTNANGIHSSLAYTHTFDLENGYVGGCAIGIMRGGGAEHMHLTGVTLQNEVNIDMMPYDVRFENVMHVPLASFPHRYVLVAASNSNLSVPIWNGTDPLPNVGLSAYNRQRGSQTVVKNWQGTGRDYLLLSRQSLADNPSWYSSLIQAQHWYNTPEKGLTMLQSWEKYGLSWGGDVLKPSEAIPLDGVIDGFGRAGLSVAFSPPRAIVTLPTTREPAKVLGNVIQITALLTGDPNGASAVMMRTEDGDPPVADDRAGDDKSWKSTHIAPGWHTITVWRTKKDKPKELLPGSEYVARYCVGKCESTEPPPPPPLRR